MDASNEAPEEDAAGAAWEGGIAHEWSAELADLQQDLYTADDGGPVSGRESTADV